MKKENGVLFRYYNSIIINRFNKLFITIFLIILISISLVSAAPSINSVSGSLQHKQSITITGSGFGVKSSAAPLKWDDFEAGMPGQVVGNGWYVWSSHGRKPLYANDTVRAGSAVSTKQDFTNGQYNCELALTGLSSHRYYITFWRYMTTTGAPSTNFKPLALRGDLDWGYPEARHDMYFDSSSGHIYTDDGEGHTPNCWTNADCPMGSWNRIEYYIDRGTPNTATGYYSYTRDGVVRAEIRNALMARTDWVWPVIFLHPFFETGDGTPRPQAYIWTDDIYIDITRARVEIGNAATFASCTHREIQIPTAWSSSSITFTTNQGNFSNGDKAYLYVIDSEGNVNENGYQVTLGSAQQCQEGSKIECYEGSAGTKNVGVCKAGTRTCSGGVYGSCIGQQLPLTEICNDAQALDEDCDGKANSQDTECACQQGAITKPCWCGTSFISSGYCCNNSPSTEGCLQNNLIAYYKFEEGSGITATDSSGNNNGIISGAVYTNNSKLGNYALKFDGFGDYVRIPYNSQLNLVNELSLAAWIYPTAITDFDYVISKAYSSYTSPYLIYCIGFASNTKRLRVVISSSNKQYQVLSPQIALNNWYFVAGTYSALDNKLTIYLNGQLVNSTTVSGSIDTNTQDVLIGMYEYASSENWNGSIDEIRIYDKALNETEIKSLYNILQTCSQQGGNICSTSQQCNGTWLSASDTNLCCLGDCYAPETPTPTPSDGSGSGGGGGGSGGGGGGGSGTPKICNENWSCQWGPCQDLTKKWVCRDLSWCNTTKLKPKDEGKTYSCLVESKCKDNDGDGYGEGEECLGEDIDDNNATLNIKPGTQTAQEPETKLSLRESLYYGILFILLVAILAVIIVLVKKVILLRKFGV